MTQLQAQSIAESLAQLVEGLKELNAKLDEMTQSKPVLAIYPYSGALNIEDGLGGENEQ